MPPPGTGRLRSLTLSGSACCVRLHRTRGTELTIDVDGIPSGARFPVFTDSQLLREELGIAGADPQFDQTLSLCPEILEILA